MTDKKEQEKEHGIYITVEGTYFSKVGTSRVPADYKLRIQLTDDPNYELPSELRLRKLAHYTLLPQFFLKNKDKYPDYYNGDKGVRECYLRETEIIDSGIKKKPKKDPEINEMSIDQLVKFAAMQELNVQPKRFSTIGVARRAVLDELENRTIAKAELIEERQKVSREKAAEFDDVKDILEFNKITLT